MSGLVQTWTNHQTNCVTFSRFSVGQLPQWAKKQLTEDSSEPAALRREMMAPKGRWAQRAETIVGVQPFYNSQPFPLMGK